MLDLGTLVFASLVVTLDAPFSPVAAGDPVEVGIRVVNDGPDPVTIEGGLVADPFRCWGEVCLMLRDSVGHDDPPGNSWSGEGPGAWALPPGGERIERARMDEVVALAGAGEWTLELTVGGVRCTAPLEVLPPRREAGPRLSIHVALDKEVYREGEVPRLRARFHNGSGQDQAVLEPLEASLDTGVPSYAADLMGPGGRRARPRFLGCGTHTGLSLAVVATIPPDGDQEVAVYPWEDWLEEPLWPGTWTARIVYRAHADRLDPSARYQGIPEDRPPFVEGIYPGVLASPIVEFEVRATPWEALEEELGGTEPRAVRAALREVAAVYSWSRRKEAERRLTPAQARAAWRACLANADRDVRRDAVESLMRSALEDGLDILAERLSAEDDPAILKRIFDGLEALDPRREWVDALLSLLEADAPWTEITAIRVHYLGDWTGQPLEWKQAGGRKVLDPASLAAFRAWWTAHRQEVRLPAHEK